MLVLITDPVGATVLVGTLGFLALAFSCRPRKDNAIFPLELSQELKGFAILAVVLAHIGYFLVDDHRFLFPLSIFAGIGVDLFLFLSGFGLATSALRKQLTIGQFYTKRLLKLYTPFWIVLAVFFAMDFFLLHISYGWNYIAQSVIGYFPHADIHHDVNSPLWYLTLIIFYYLVFPVIFSKKRAWLSAIGLFVITRFIIWLNPAFLSGTISLYKVHLAAFPLGILMAYVLSRKPSFSFSFLQGALRKAAYYLIFVLLIAVAGYTAINSGVGKSPVLQESLSLVTMSAIILVFMMKKVEFRLLYIFGVFSYEVYLLHWPLMSRYDFLFSWLPPWLAVLLYFGIFLGLGWGLQKMLDSLDSKKMETKKHPLSGDPDEMNF